MRKRVLLIDDDAQFRALIRVALDEIGLDVVEAGTGREGLRLLREDPDLRLLIVDGLLPDTNGIKWIQSIRASGVNLPVIFVSAFFKDLASYRKLTNELGVAEVLRKPVDVTDFARRVRAQIPRARKSSVTIDLSEIEAELAHSAEPSSAGFVYAPDERHDLTPLPFGVRPLLGPDVFVLSNDESLLAYVRTSLASTVANLDGATSLDTIPEGATPRVLILGLPFGQAGDATAAIRRLSGNTPPRIAVVADRRPATARLAQKLQADILLPPTFDAHALLSTLRRLEALGDPSPPRVLIWPSAYASLCADALDDANVRLRRARTWPRLRRLLKIWHPHALVVDAAHVPRIRELRMAEGGHAPALIVVGPTDPAEALLEGATLVLEHDKDWRTVIPALAMRNRVRLRDAVDRLTRMPRRHQALPHLHAALAEARRAKRPFTFAFLSIAGGSSLSARVGDEPAAEAIAAFGSLLQARFRMEDLRIRWTRDVFALGFPRSTAAEIKPAIARIHAELKAMRFEGVSGPFRLRFSVGLATFGPDGESVRDILAAAEIRLRANESRQRSQVLRERS